VWFYSADLSNDGRRLLTNSEDSALLWEADSGGLVATFGGLADYYRAEFNPDGWRVLTTAKDKTVRL